MFSMLPDLTRKGLATRARVAQRKPDTQGKKEKNTWSNQKERAVISSKTGNTIQEEKSKLDQV